MNAYLNYLLEASIGLCLFLVVYQLFLRKETTFRFNRIFLLIAIISSVTFPLISISTEDSPVPSLSLTVDASAFVPASEATQSVSALSVSTGMNTWDILTIIYASGLMIFFTVFMIRLLKMFRTFQKSRAYTYHNHNIVELKDANSPFSFFNYIFIGNTPPLTEKEKQQIISHEGIHARLFHSFDIVLLNMLGIVFWFNPVIRIYKKIFVQLHEFEADARAVETHDVDEYCSLLARVALHSADYKLANHFSNSLTLKRIEMMRKLKHKIKSWKIAAVAAVIPIVFFAVACQDQVETPQNAQSTTLVQRAIPLKISKEVERLKKLHPEDEFIVISPEGHNPKDFEGEHAKHISTIDGSTVFEASSITVMEDGKDESGKALRYMILQYTNKQEPSKIVEPQNLAAIREEPANQINGEPVFTTVEKPAMAPGGYVAFNQRLNNNMQYPATSCRTGVEGAVYIKIVVTKDGALTNFEIVKGVNREIDMEALRLIKSEAQSAWKPAVHNGKPVHSILIIPVLFKLNK